MSEQANMPLAFGAVLAGSLMLQKGLAAVRGTFSSAGSSAGAVTSGVQNSPLDAGLTATALTAAVQSRANAIDAAHLPYSYGGGHDGRANLSDLVPLDCSAAVSAVLGIDPRVSSQFERFGSPGASPDGKGVTIFANGRHVLMEINGRFFGTSRSNPGGGAGWIDSAQISAGYLSGFTARHLERSR